MTDSIANVREVELISKGRAVEAKDKHGRPIRIGDLAYGWGCEASGVVVGIALDHVVIEYIDEDGDVVRWSDCGCNIISGGPATVAMPQNPGDHAILLAQAGQYLHYQWDAFRAIMDPNTLGLPDEVLAGEVAKAFGELSAVLSK